MLFYGAKDIDSLAAAASAISAVEPTLAAIGLSYWTGAGGIQVLLQQQGSSNCGSSYRCSALSGVMFAHSKSLLNSDASKLANTTKPFKGVSNAEFGSIEKLEGHFAKHGGEFKGIYNTADEYLQGARDVMNNGYKVQYQYKGEIRTGYARFMESSSKGVAKFEFVGTNSAGEITTYHVESGKDFWKMLNGQNIPVINPID